MTTAFASMPAPPPPRDPSVADAVLADWESKAERFDDAALRSLLQYLEAHPTARDLVAAITCASPFLRGLMERQPAFLHDCLECAPESALERLLDETQRLAEASDSEARLMSELRGAKAKSALLIALADIAGLWDVAAATQALTRFADTALSGAVDWLLRDAARRAGTETAAAPDSGGYFVLAMGKYGAHELNYSSDIDLIVFFDPERAGAAMSDPSTHFVRLTRRLVKILQERTGDGYVFRVDLRLRPDPRATSVAIALEAAAQYYESMGQNWERAAMIKARPVAGDLGLGAEFLERLAPFIWRKYLDYAAIADVQSLKRQIHAFKGHGEIAIAGHNIKLGRGGIREIEFFVQTQQLIAGGRAPHLRGNQTVPMLAKLAEHDWITRTVADDMTKAYWFLRMVEHRIQMVDDEQTHTLPTEPDRLEDLARFAGFASYQPFAAELLRQLETVQGHYAALFEAAPSLGDEQGSLVFTGGEDDPETLETLERMGYQRPSDVSAIVRGWHFGRMATTRSAKARELLTEIMPVLLDALARTGQPDQALIAFDRFLSGLPAGVQLFSLLKANPQLLRLLADILGAAPRLADILARRSKILDAVLDPGFFGPLPGHSELACLTEEHLPSGPLEEILDAARVFGREQRFRIGVRILSDTVSADEAGRAYSNLAEGLIAQLFDVVCREFASRHGVVEGGAAAVVAMGKLGGREMTASSDLDLMLIYDFDETAQGSDGPNSLTPGLYYTRLTQRLINALTAQTAEGELYEVDMRLRPSGNKGPIATHISSFVDYHATSAWTWEKLALTRARSVAGDPSLRNRIDGAILDALCESRDSQKTASDVIEMRQRIADERGDANIWDLKNAQGGMVDLEFVSQYLQIANARQVPDCLDENTQAAFGKLAAEGLLAPKTARDLIDASRLMGALSQVLRLCLDTQFEPDNAPAGLKTLLQRAADAIDFAQLENTLRDSQETVKTAYNQLLGRTE
jgi:glutamate-ammonia-ligase adenylyltransferase